MKKHILCLGDSNTHGYCADPADCADGGIRFNEDERWTCRLQKALGGEYLVTEEGLSGRTTVFVDPIHESMDALSVAYPLLKSHEVIDLDQWIVSCKYRSIVCDTTELAVLEKASPSVR